MRHPTREPARPSATLGPGRCFLGSRALHARLVRFCMKAGAPRDAAEDLVQDAYASLLKFESTGANILDPESFLRRSVRNLAINRYWHEKRQSPMELRYFEQLIDPAPLIERIIDARTELERFASKIQSALGSRGAQVLLDHAQGFTCDEMSVTLAVSTRTVKKWLAKARVYLDAQGS